ncbi:MAG: hypothetical protein HY318_12150 [Armatimonadetes bacterium]|nr:hypothetical protein [Armatimonadota bacterium]
MSCPLDQMIVRLGIGEGLEEGLRTRLDPVEAASYSFFEISPPQKTELHYHDIDEYWLFTEGTTTVTLRSENGETLTVRVGPYTLVVTPAGIEHAHTPQTSVRGVQWTSVVKGRGGRHLTR